MFIKIVQFNPRAKNTRDSFTKVYSRIALMLCFHVESVKTREQREKHLADYITEILYYTRYKCPISSTSC